MGKVKVYIINMPSNQIRRQYMYDLCAKYTDILDFEFIEAVDGRNLSKYQLTERYNQQQAMDFLHREMGAGEIGCLLSHVSIYHKIIENNIKYALVLEDDVHFDEKLLDALSIVHQYPSDWELVLYGHYSFHLNQKEIRSPISYWKKFRLDHNLNLHRLSKYGYGTHAYLINQQGAQRLLKQLCSFYMPIDHYTNNTQYINVYACHPTLAKVNLAFDSSISSDRTAKLAWFKRYSIVWAIRNLFYYIMPPLKY